MDAIYRSIEADRHFRISLFSDSGAIARSATSIIGPFPSWVEHMAVASCSAQVGVSQSSLVIGASLR